MQGVHVDPEHVEQPGGVGSHPAHHGQQQVPAQLPPASPQGRQSADIRGGVLTRY